MARIISAQNIYVIILNNTVCYTEKINFTTRIVCNLFSISIARIYNCVNCHVSNTLVRNILLIPRIYNYEFYLKACTYQWPFKIYFKRKYCFYSFLHISSLIFFSLEPKLNQWVQLERGRRITHRPIKSPEMCTYMYILVCV